LIISKILPDKAFSREKPTIELAQHTGISQCEINVPLKIVKDNEPEIRTAWNRNCPS
jgi:hypothetical protein